MAEEFEGGSDEDSGAGHMPNVVRNSTPAAASGGACPTRFLHQPSRRILRAKTTKKENRSMKIAIPVEEYRGLESTVYGHFGSALAFALVDVETMAVEAIGNRDQTHVHGACSPMKALAGAKPDAVIVGGIGMGALMGLRASGIKVYRAVGGTVADAVRQFKAAELPGIEEDGACAGHGGDHSCHKG